MDGDTKTFAITETPDDGRPRDEPTPGIIFPKLPSELILEAHDVSPRKRRIGPDDETKEFPALIPRPSQWMVDAVYAVKSVGLVTTVVLMFLWFIPSGTKTALDNVISPLVGSQIEKDHALAAAIKMAASNAESNQKQTREAVTSLVGFMSAKHEDELTTQVLLRELRDELRANRRGGQ